MVMMLRRAKAMTTAEFIGREEGFRSKAYQDSEGNWTIGFGRLLSTDASADPSQWPDVDRDVEAEQHFAPTVARFRAGVRKLITAPLDPDAETALVSFSYNLGLGALQRSKLRRLINAELHGQFDTAGAHARWTARVILEWVDWSNVTIMGKKTASAGLVDRRRRECALFFGVSLG